MTTSLIIATVALVQLQLLLPVFLSSDFNNHLAVAESAEYPQNNKVCGGSPVEEATVAGQTHYGRKIR